MQECYEVHEPDKKKIAELKSIMMDEPIAPKSKMKSFSKIGGSFLRKVKVSLSTSIWNLLPFLEYHLCFIMMSLISSQCMLTIIAYVSYMV